MWEQIKKSEGLDMKVWEVGKIIGQKWRELSDDDKQVMHTCTRTQYNYMCVCVYSYNGCGLGGALCTAKTSKSQEICKEQCTHVYTVCDTYM